MEKQLLFTFLCMLFPSKTCSNSNPNAHRYMRTLEAGGVTELWQLLRKTDDELMAFCGIGPAFVNTLRAYKIGKGI